MKTKYYLLLIMLSVGSNFLFAQHENDNWLFGNNKWKFDNSSPSGFTHTTNINPYIRYVSSVISDKSTGSLLFYSDGYKIYNKNGAVMNGGNDLFNTNNVAFNTYGNPSDQSSIIVPLSNSNSIYYVFYINGNRKVDDQGNNSDTTAYNYGLRYAIVDMTLNGGLGGVTSKNNVLFSTSPTNALTSTVASDGMSYWIVSANNGNFLSYKLNSNGLNTTPVMSPATNYGNFFKISPNSKKLATRINTYPNNGVYLYTFNNFNGSVTNPTKITTDSDSQNFNNTIEFSANSNSIYYLYLSGCLCGNSTIISYIKGYDLVTNTPMYNSQYLQNGVSMQRAENGKIYLMLNNISEYNLDGTRKVDFGWTNTATQLYYSYGWMVLNNPNNSNPGPLDNIQPQSINNTKNGYSFPQLIPHLENNPCPDNQNIDYPVITSQNFQAGQSITASSTINDGLTVNYKAGNNVTLLPGFYVRATENSLFHAYIGRCDGIITNFARNSNTSINNIFKETKVQTSDLKISPNPASTFINIDSGNEKITSWELLDISGRSILKGSSNKVNVQGLPKTTYLLNINISNKTITKKVIVK